MSSAPSNEDSLSEFVEDAVVPVLARPSAGGFRFLGTGFFLGNRGGFITCRHVVEALDTDESLGCYQIGLQRQMPLELVKISEQFDLAYCLGEEPRLPTEWPLARPPLATLGEDTEVIGYWSQPGPPDKLPFRTRVLKGYITSISDPDEYPETFELSSPFLPGMSGSPLIYHVWEKGEVKSTPSIAGCVYGTRQTDTVLHEVVEAERLVERTSRIYQLGLAYNANALLSLLEGTGEHPLVSVIG